MVLCHAAAADATSPKVNARDPVAGATGVAVTSGVGLSFTDNLKPWTISSATLPVRIKSTGAVVPGYYSYQLNTVNFRPAADFARGTVYEVAVTGGVKDLAGNGATASAATFTTQN
jgi:Bacterial Ig-like domain